MQNSPAKQGIGSSPPVNCNNSSYANQSIFGLLPQVTRKLAHPDILPNMQHVRLALIRTDFY
jgi:hypothetical protein